jgi:integrase
MGTTMSVRGPSTQRWQRPARWKTRQFRRPDPAIASCTVPFMTEIIASQIRIFSTPIQSSNQFPYRPRIAFGRFAACRNLTVPANRPLKAAFDAAKKHGPIVLTSTDGRPWTPDGFRASWGKACAKAGIVGVTFNDLRGTAVTRLVLAECTEAEIATITGHALRDVRSILDAHCLHRDPALAESAIRKLGKGTKSPN